MKVTFPADVRRKGLILHLAMISSLIVYGVALYFVLRSGSREVEPDPETVKLLLPILGGLGALELLASFFLPRIIVSDEKLLAALPRDAERPEVVARQAAQLTLTASIIRWAIIESVAIYGFVLGMLGRDLMLFLYFGAPALRLVRQVADYGVKICRKPTAAAVFRSASMGRLLNPSSRSRFPLTSDLRQGRAR